MWFLVLDRVDLPVLVFVSIYWRQCHTICDLYKGLPNPFPAGRYHSLRAVRAKLPAELELTAWTEEGLVMGVQHKQRPWFGMQFHPESILTPQGDRMLQQFLHHAGEAASSS